MELNTGRKVFEITFDGEEKEKIYFNPTDPALFARLGRLRSNIIERTKKIEDFEIDGEGNPVNEEDRDKFENTMQIIYEEFDKAFGSSVSSVVFSKCSPYAIVDDKLFMIHFLEKMTEEIDPYVKEHTRKLSEKIKKHTGKYIHDSV